MDYTALGHTVGLAARMEQLCEAGRVYLTAATAALVEGFFAHEELGPVTKKGVREPEGAPGSDQYGPVRRVPLRGGRRKISQALHDSMTKAAQVTATDEADCGLLWLIRNKEKEEAAQQGVRLTLLPFIVKAVVGALKRDPCDELSDGRRPGRNSI
jgi:pyruvate/2-oxoglutarate dehydrogenase complex dihydrolipoamide acyltransferase (E2) component